MWYPGEDFLLQVRNQQEGSNSNKDRLGERIRVREKEERVGLRREKEHERRLWKKLKVIQEGN